LDETFEEIAYDMATTVADAVEVSTFLLSYWRFGTDKYQMGL
jgi:hypothetical protein